jgi:hypothetical protein
MKGTLKDLFAILNSKCNYLILRNWNNLFSKGVYEAGHADIDILCESKASFVELTGAKRIHKEKNRDNYIVPMDDNGIRFDVRWVGDGYYPTSWEHEMLNNRVLNEDSVYVMSERDHFYSLAYHALLQKKELSDEYANKLNTTYNLFTSENTILTEDEIVQKLLSFMKKNKLKAEIPVDPGVFLNLQVYSLLPHNYSISRLLLRKAFCIKTYLSHQLRRITNRIS